jgi:hypothetical protein
MGGSDDAQQFMEAGIFYSPTASSLLKRRNGKAESEGSRPVEGRRRRKKFLRERISMTNRSNMLQ